MAKPDPHDPTVKSMNGPVPPLPTGEEANSDETMLDFSMNWHAGMVEVGADRLLETLSRTH